MVGKKGPNWGPAFPQRRHEDAVIAFLLCETGRPRWMTVEGCSTYQRIGIDGLI